MYMGLIVSLSSAALVFGCGEWLVRRDVTGSGAGGCLDFEILCLMKFLLVVVFLCLYNFDEVDKCMFGG